MVPASSTMVSCERVIELLLDYLEGELSPELQAAMDRHWEACPPCVEFARQYKATSALCRSELAREMPAKVRDHVLEFLRDEIER